VGRDDHGTRLIDLQRAAGVDVAGIGLDAAPTGLAFITVDRAGENQIVVASGANGQVRASDVPDPALGPECLVVAQMELAATETAAVLNRARARGARTLLNLAPALPIDPTALGAVDWLVVNRVEAAMLAATLGLAEAAPATVARRLARVHGLTCIVTLGRDGAIAADAVRAWAVDALAVTAIDTTGAGDAFVGNLAAALDRGASLPDSLRRASVAAGLACTARGAQSALPDRADIDRAMGRLAPARTLAVSE
jgi:ribokinase